ncbi:TIGR03905 family TSCPD domain-containing protein [Orenia marismortui]|uniref:TIGR03905 family TSCPD domain-containing protein n=1 Tax=Orenia marismortui TaxID=46469 RepID=UPI000378D07B|nr:TIGR03905 family TSCPD domain-containing protein [Orenia marismortui]
MKVFKTSGVCAREIRFKINDKNIIEKVSFIGGCNGNQSAISALVEGQTVKEVANKLAGIECRNGTSCPDQLSKALKKLA